MNHPAGSPDLALPVTPGTARLRLVAVVVTHNRRMQLHRTIDRLLAEDVDAILVIDNASTDGSTDALFKLDNPRLHIVVLTENIGGAGGFEQGLRVATERWNPDWCVVMDDDARPDSGVMGRFVARAAGFERDGFEAVAAGVFYPDGHICEMNRPSLNPFWNLLSFLRTLVGGGRGGFHVSDRDYDRHDAKKVDASSFVGLFLSRAAIARAGFPDGNLFIYGDDVLYTLKLSRAGGMIGFAPWLRFEHDCTTFRRGGGHIHRPLWKVYYNYRNGLLAYREAAGPILFWPVLLVVVPKWISKARSYGADWRLYLALLRLALGDALLHRLHRSHHEIRVRSRHVDPPPEVQAR